MKCFFEKLLLFFLFVITSALSSFPSYCQALDIAQENNSALGSFATIITESEKVNSADEILIKFQQGGGYKSKTVI
ncbi:hypothetical protein [Candidatus Colwellia aromaticivorans]|uniref:hypothetical protein n=1 Tax=Candidatus Colwellia aromaticivorans TaxID=2267621 RepID=UPI000DF38378|nr:hypothetical protein [Candidatus Colwellia aromaticivorans]